MPTYDVDVAGLTYEVDAPDENTAWRWANYEHRKRAAAEAAKPQPEGGFFPAVRQGFEGLKGSAAALAGRVGLMDEAEAQAAYEAAQKRQQEIFKPTEEGWTEAPFTKFKETLGGSLAYMAAPLVAAGAAATLPVTGTAATVATLGAAGLTSAAQFTATNLSRQMEEGKKLAETDLGAAALTAGLQAALDTLSLRLLPGVGRILGDAGIKVTKETAKEVSEQILKKAAIDYTAATGKAMGVEGLTEAAQQGLERLQAGLSLTDASARDEYLESLIGGAVLGGTFGAAGRAYERGRAGREVQAVEEGQAREAREATRAAEEVEKKTPEYLLTLDKRYADAVAQMRQMQEAVKTKPGKDAAPDARAEYQQQVEALKKFVNETMRPLTAEYTPRKAEIAQLKERQRVEGMTPLEYQMEQAGVDLTAPPKEERVFTGEEELAQPPSPEVQYAQQQMALAQQQDLGTFEAKNFAEYLLQDPAMAQRLVETRTAIPGVSKKESDAILGGIKLQLTEQAKQQAKQERAATQAELQQRQADLKAQQQAPAADPLELWKSSIEQTEEQATEELLRPDFSVLRPTETAVEVAPGIRPVQNPDQSIKRLDELVAARDQAAKDTDTAFAAGNKELGVKKAQEREAAQSALNQLEQVEGPTRALTALRKAQDAALMNAAQLADDLRAGRTLGGPEAGTASSTPQTLINQINRERAAYINAAVQEAAITRKLYGKALPQDEALKAGLDMKSVFDEWVTRSMAQPVKDVNWVDRLVAEANARGAVAGKELRDAPWVQQMKQDFIRAQMTDALAKRLGRQRMEEIAKGTAELKGAETELPADTRKAVESKAAVDFDRLLRSAQEKALAQSTDPRPLEERQFGAYRAATAVLDEQLRKIASELKKVPREFRREEPLLKMQFPETEAAKVAEAKGETAQTLEGQLRRRRDYAQGLIDQAFQTRKVPGIAEALLTRAQDFLSSAPNTLLDAVENVADRIVRGQTLERSDLVALRDEVRAASARPGEAEVVGERAKQRELFPAAERREDLGLIREKPAAFEAARAKAAAKQARADAAIAKSEKLTQDIKAQLDRIDAEREAMLEQRVEDRSTSLQSAWQSAVKKSITLVRNARQADLQKQASVLQKEINAVYKAGVEGLTKENIDRLATARAALENLPKDIDKVVETAEFLPQAQASKWVAFERKALEEARAALAAERTAQNQQKVNRQQAALQRAEQARLQSLKGEEKTAESARMRAAQTGLGLPGMRVERQQLNAQITALEERIPKIQDKKKKAKAVERLAELRQAREASVSKVAPAEAAKERAAEEAEQRREAREAAVARGEEKRAERDALEQRVLDLGAQVADREAAQKRARTPESKARIQEEIDALNKDTEIAQAQLAAFEEGKPRRKGPATVPTAEALGARTPLRTGTRKETTAERTRRLETASEAMRRERTTSPSGTYGEDLTLSDVAGSIDFSYGGVRSSMPETSKRTGIHVAPIQKTAQPLTSKITYQNASANMLVRASGFTPEAAPFNGMTFAEAARYGAGKTSSPARKALFNALADVFDAAPKGVKQGIVLSTTGKTNQRGASGVFVAKFNRVLTPSSANSGYLETLLHELTHAATYYGLTKNPELAKQVDGLRLQTIEWAQSKEGRAYIRKNAFNLLVKSPKTGKNHIYGVTNIDEFLAELYSNSAFQKMLTQIPSNKPKKNLLTRFVELISTLFDLDTKEQQSVFAEAMALSEDVLRVTRDEVYGTSQDLKELVARDNAEPELASVRATYAPEFKGVGETAESLLGSRPSVFQRLKANLLGRGFRTNWVDKLAPTEAALKEAVNRGQLEDYKAAQSMYYLRMYDQRSHFTSMAITDGAPVIRELDRKGGGKEYLIESEPGANIKQVVDILARKDVVKAAGSADAASRLFTLYDVAKRAERTGFDKLNLKDPKITEESLREVRAKVDGNAVLKDAFKEARDTYNTYNRNLLEFVRDTGALPKELVDELLRYGDYIPFYRANPKGEVELVLGSEISPVRIANLKDSPHLKELIGGDKPVLNFLESSVQNSSMLLDMALKNLSQKNLAWEMSESGLGKNFSVEYEKGGKTVKRQPPEGALMYKLKGKDWFFVPDEAALNEMGVDAGLLMKGLEGIPTMFPTVMKLLSAPTRLLRRMVVASPPYMARQLMRDSLAAVLTSGANMTPVLSAIKQIGRKGALDRRGIVGGQVFTGLPEDMSTLLKQMQSGKPGWTQALAKLEAISMEVDASNRRAQYESYLQQGLSEMEATYMALESMNFSKRGLSPSVHMATQLIPFFNAQIQGLDVLYKSLTGKMPFEKQLDIKNKLYTKGLLMAAGSIVYALAMQDDEAYQNANPDEKYGNWFVRIPGFEEPFRVPIPFELGYIFKALPEAVVNIALRDEGAKEAKEAFSRILLNTIPGGSSYGLPQAIKPAIEVGLGKSFFTGRDIESSKEQMLEPFARFREKTTDAAKWVGEQFNISPIKLEYLIQGYTGSLGMAMLAALNPAFPDVTAEGATKRLSEYPLVGGFFQPNDAGGIINATYERMKDIQQIQNTYKDMLTRQGPEAARAYAEKNAQELAAASLAGRFRQEMGELTKQEREVRAARNLTPERKRELMDRLKQAKIRLATVVRSSLDRTTRQAVPA